MKSIFRIIVTFSLLASFITACGESSVQTPTEVSAQFASVGTDFITQKSFEEATRYFRFTLINQYQQIVLLANAATNSPALQESYFKKLDQLAASLQPAAVGQSVLNSMINNLLIRQEAKRRNITVSPAELDAFIKEQFGLYSGQGAGPSPLPTSTLNPTQAALVDSQGLTSQAVIAATPTSISETDFSTKYAEYIKQANDQAEISEATIRYSFESNLFRRKVMDAVVDRTSIPRVQEQVWARHILVADQESALKVIARLKAGEKFSNIAADVSIDTSTALQGGDLGWFSKGDTLPEFEAEAFRLQIGEISAPIKTSSGYHVIQVLGHEIRPLSDSQYQSKVNQSFNDWLDGQWKNGAVRIRSDWQSLVPMLPAFTPVPLP